MCNILNNDDVVNYMLSNEDENDNEEEYTDEELDNYGLTDEEKKLVKEEGWSPFAFNDDEDEEEPDDDDYYNDDF